MQTSLQQQKTNQWLYGMEVEDKNDYQGAREGFGMMENSVSQWQLLTLVSKLIELHTLNECSLLHVNYTSIKNERS